MSLAKNAYFCKTFTVDTITKLKFNLMKNAAQSSMKRVNRKAPWRSIGSDVTNALDYFIQD